MRVTASILVLLAASAPAYAQTATTWGAMSMVNISDPANVNTTTRLTTPPTIVAPGLAAAGVETCLGSASGGLSLMGTGLTFGSTVPDSGRTLRLTAQQLYAFGFKAAAIALMCQDQHVAEAMATVGEACPSAHLAANDGPEISVGSIGRPRPVSQPLQLVPPRVVEPLRWSDFARLSGRTGSCAPPRERISPSPSRRWLPWPTWPGWWSSLRKRRGGGSLPPETDPASSPRD